MLNCLIYLFFLKKAKEVQERWRNPGNRPKKSLSWTSLNLRLPTRSSLHSRYELPGCRAEKNEFKVQLVTALKGINLKIHAEPSQKFRPAVVIFEGKINTRT